MEAATLQFPWRQLGELLVAEEFLTKEELEQALAEQASSGRLLGQILVNNGYLSAFSLARVLSEQHGVQLQPRDDETIELTPPTDLQPAPTWRPLGKLLVELGLVTESQLERALALQRVEAHNPPALEIHRTHGAAQETVWNYSASRAAAVQAERKGLAETFGFDPVRWGKKL